MQQPQANGNGAPASPRKKQRMSTAGTVSKVTVVLGAQWGDEGKGKVVDMLAMEADVVCRCQVRFSLRVSLPGFGSRYDHRAMATRPSRHLGSLGVLVDSPSHEVILSFRGTRTTACADDRASPLRREPEPFRRRLIEGRCVESPGEKIRLVHARFSGKH